LTFPFLDVIVSFYIYIISRHAAIPVLQGWQDGWDVYQIFCACY